MIFQFTPLREGRRGRGHVPPAPPDFNSRPSARGDAKRALYRRDGGYFNSRPSARGDLRWNVNNAYVRTISIHAPPRGATTAVWTCPARPTYFNSRPSARGDAVRVMPSAQASIYFNSRPSARGDPRRNTGSMGRAISIHAPPRGATRAVAGHADAVAISIHAPPRGATGNQHYRAADVMISIHAPPRGATE